MTTTPPWAERLLEHRLVQPDDRSCGAASLVVAHAVRNEGYAEFLVTGEHPVTGWHRRGSVEERFAEETLAMHHRITGSVDVAGRVQLPWPRPLGTPPWAVAHQLSTRSTRYVVRPALLRRGAVLDNVRAGLEAGPVPVFIGDRWAPRHVVLTVTATPGGVACYDPAQGGVHQVSRTAFTTGRLPLGRWPRPWFVVLPVPRS